ncbi:MAG: type II toxin-antitoxin system HicA family toxin [Patescibacteria group bacterium]
MLIPKLPTLTSKDVVKIIKNLGFKEIRQKGSHKFFCNPKTKNTTLVPMHSKDLGRGLTRKIISDTNVSVKEFLRAKK